MDSLDKRKKNVNKLIADIELLGEKAKKQSEKVYDEAVEYVIKKNDSLTPYVLNSIVTQQINNALRRIVNNFNGSFEDIIKKTQKDLASGYDIKLSESDLTAISKSKSIIIDKLLNNTTILKNDIKTILYSNLGRGVSKTQLIKRLKDLYPAYSRNAYTIVNTGLSRELQDINITKFSQFGYNWYIWAGPNDKLTRELPCTHWVNHKFPASQLDILRATRGSLWNCRHSVIPITDEEAKDYPEGDISFAI